MVAPFSALAARADPPLDALGLALAAEFRPVDAPAALARLDRLGAEVRRAAGTQASPHEQAGALRAVLGEHHGFAGDIDDYDDPANSMLDLVLERRKGLPILLSVVWVEVARRAGIALAGVGLPGHFVTGHFGATPPLLLDPFGGGQQTQARDATEVRPWTPHETALRMLNNLVGSYTRRADLGRAIRAAELRIALPLADSDAVALGRQLRSLRARLN